MQHWYANSTTGQNENYGIVLQYADSSIADYNSVYSADCTDATMRPSMVIGYTPPNSEINVLEGYTKQLPLPDTTETITWTSSNENVATVNSNGVVTGVKAGKVTVTASAGGNELHTYTVYVKIEDGIYRIGYQNENVEVYLTVLDGALENAITKMQVAATDELPMYRQLWRITYLAEGYYVMRPMHNQNLAFHAQDGVSDVTTIGYNNTLSGVPAENRCCIEYLDGGYVFKCQSDSTQALRRSGNHPGTTVYTTIYDATNSAFKWYFYNAPYITPQMLMLDTQMGTSIEGKVVVLEQGQSMTLADLNMAVSLACTSDNNQNITWYSDSSSVEVDLSTGEILAVTGGGRAKISAQCIHNGILHEAGYRVYIKPNFDNTFFIQNAKHYGYIQLNISNSSGENGSSNASIEHWTFTDGDHQRWLIQPRANGYYSIISVDTGKALSVPSGHELSTSASLIQEQYTGNDRQLWKIITTNDGRCKIKAKSAESSGSDLVIAMGDSGSNGASIIQSSYVYDDNYADEWYLAEIGYASDVQVEGQQKVWWCWVTCARMFAKHFYPAVSYTQEQAARYALRNVVSEGSEAEAYNLGGDTKQTQEAIAFYLSTTSSLYVETQENNQSIYSEATLLRFLDDGYVVEVGRINYPNLDKEQQGYGHGVLIYGYVTIGTEHRFLVRDPAPMNIGSSYMMSYGKLCIGQNAQWGEESDYGVWETSVVVKTTYSNDVIPYYFGNHH